MNDVQPDPRMRLSRALNDLAKVWPTLVDAQYNSSSSGNATNSKVQTSGHSDIGGQWRPAVTHVVDELQAWAAYLGRLLIGNSTTTVWPKDVQLALATAARPRLARALIENPDTDDILTDTLTLRAQAQRALHTTFLRRRELAATCLCEVYVDDENGDTVESICGASLTAVFDGPRSRILCAAHPFEHTVPATAWDRFLMDVQANA